MHYHICVLVAIFLTFAHADELQFTNLGSNAVLYKDQAVNISYVAIHSGMAYLQWAELDLMQNDNTTLVIANMSRMTPDEIFGMS
ncbi:hypothetical protein DFQ27_000077 [Actinomortierella ambigua]|uniref:Uncharacterized protein n=1 Tax=Actinomortierella ambigua TaxID=1343610 RepID=A0A9P6UD67_9FUNG|nr:hypothetical protein DFQ27_000077 [Actinomortierella ambigua]